MSGVYELAIVGAGLSALSAIAAGLGREQSILLDYQDERGGFLQHALPAPGFEAAWELIRSTRIPQSITTCFGATVVGLLPAFEGGEAHTLVVRQRQGTSQVQAKRILIACGGLGCGSSAGAPVLPSGGQGRRVARTAWSCACDRRRAPRPSPFSPRRAGPGHRPTPTTRGWSAREVG